MNYTRKVAFNTAAQMLGKVLGTAISIATVAALFRYFGVEGMGKYTTVFAFVAFFSVFADFGLQWTLIRELAINPDHDKVFKNIFTFRLFLAIFIHSISFAAVWFFNYPLEVKLGVGVINLAWFFITMNTTLVGVFLNNYRMDISVANEILGRVFILILVIVTTKLKLPFVYVISAYLIGDVINFVSNFIFARRYVRPGFRVEFPYWRRVVGQALPIGIALVFHFIYFKIDSLMLSVMKPMVDVGIYGTAYKLLEVLETVPAMFLGAAFPLVTRYAITKDRRLNEAFQKQFDFLVLLAVPIVTGTFVLAEPIIRFIGGSRGGEFVSASTVSLFSHPITSVTCLKVLIFAVGISFISQLYSYMIVSLGRQRAMIIPTISFALFNIVLNLILIPKISYIGTSIATIITEVIVAIVVYMIFKKFIHLPIKLARSFRVLLAGVLMGLVVWWLNSLSLNLFVNLTIAVLLYVGLVFALRAVTKEMVTEIIRRKEV
ncbi:MAG: flippase [Candidatus Berkelbacteria bacterium]|nr:flippase [Candidatus Berkelbacteria bacterium]